MALYRKRCLIVNMGKMQVLCFFAIIMVFIVFPGPLFCQEKPQEPPKIAVPEQQYGKLSDISSEPPYIRLLYRNEVFRVPWVYNITSFLGPQEEELSPREFLERYKDRPVIVFMKEGKAERVVESIE